MYTLEEYQENAVQDLLKGEARYLALEMGLGKTLVILDYLKRTKQRALIVAPLLVAQRTWPQEIAKWGFDFKYSVLHGNKKQEALLAEDDDIKIINYEGLQWLADNLGRLQGVAQIAKRVLILDESTHIKSHSSARFKILKALAPLVFAKNVICMSGTPMPKSYLDLWSQYYLLDKGQALGKNITTFKRNHFIETGAPRWLTTLIPGSDKVIQKAIAPITTVLRSKDYLKLPDVLYRDKPVDLPSGAKALYNKLQKDYELEHGDFVYEAQSAGTLVNKLRQLTQGGMYNEAGYDEFHDAKLEALQELLESADGSPILCPIAFKFELEMIRKRLGKDVPCIAGGTCLKDKEHILDRWDKGEVPLLLCHPASLSHGLNMQLGGNIICWFGLPWSLEQYHQLNGRLTRRGQLNTVVIWHLVAKGTIDARLVEVLKNKEVSQENFKQAIIDSIHAV